MGIQHRIQSNSFTVYYAKWPAILFTALLGLIILAAGIFFALYLPEAGKGTGRWFGWMFASFGVATLAMAVKSLILVRDKEGTPVLKLSADGINVYPLKKTSETIKWHWVEKIVFTKTFKHTDGDGTSISKNNFLILFKKDKFQRESFLTLALKQLSERPCGGACVYLAIPKGYTIHSFYPRMQSFIPPAIPVEFCQRVTLDLNSYEESYEPADSI